MYQSERNNAAEKGGALVWLALALAALSLWLSWNTYNTVSGERLEDLIKEQVRSAVEEVKKTLARENEAPPAPAQEKDAE